MSLERQSINTQPQRVTEQIRQELLPIYQEAARKASEQGQVNILAQAGNTFTPRFGPSYVEDPVKVDEGYVAVEIKFPRLKTLNKFWKIEEELQKKAGL